MLLPGDWAKDAMPYLLPNAGSNFFNVGMSSMGGDGALEPWQSLIVIIVWLVASLAAAALLLRRRDA
jgi:ABC-2 type transport system permease protein